MEIRVVKIYEVGDTVLDISSGLFGTIIAAKLTEGLDPSWQVYELAYPALNFATKIISGIYLKNPESL